MAVQELAVQGAADRVLDDQEAADLALQSAVADVRVAAAGQMAVVAQAAAVAVIAKPGNGPCARRAGAISRSAFGF